MKKIIYSLITLAITVIILTASLGCSGCSFVKETGHKENLPDSQVMAKTVNFTENQRTDDKFTIEEAVKAVERTSVAITTTYTEGGQKKTSAGSGIILDVKPEGQTDENIVYILTCHHMMKENGEIVVFIPDEYCLYNNEDYIFTGVIGGNILANSDKAITLIGGDKESDVALIKLDLNRPARSGNKLSIDKIVKARIPQEGYTLNKGETVIAIGNPTGELPGTVTTGVIGYLQRETQIEGIGTMKLLQISVAINHGSSGGGLYNLYGELVGITNSGNDSYEFVNFAIPMSVYDPEAFTDNGFINIVSQLLGTYNSDNYGYISGRKAKFGFTVTETETDGNTALYVSEVTTNSLAQSAGIMQQDIIKSVSVKKKDETVYRNAVAINSLKDYKEQVDDLKVGDSFKIVVERREIDTIDIFGRTTYKKVEKTIELTYVQYYFCDTGIYPAV